jgi:hypothetical protein
MTEEQLQNKVNELAYTIHGDIIKGVYKLVRSGAIDMTKYEDNYRLPKNYVSAMCSWLANQYKAYDKKDQKEIKNITLYL